MANANANANANVMVTLSYRFPVQLISMFEIVHGVFLTLFYFESLPKLMDQIYAFFFVLETHDDTVTRKLAVESLLAVLIFGCCIAQFTRAYNLLRSTNLNMPLRAAIKSAESWEFWNCFLVVLIIVAWITYTSCWIPTSGLYHAFYGMHLFYRFVGYFAVYKYMEEMEIEVGKPSLPIIVPKEKRQATPLKK